MANLLPSFVVLALGLLSSPVLTDFIYTAVSPTALRPLSTYSIVTTVEKSSVPVAFTFLISTDENETIASQEVSIPGDTTQLVDLKIGELLDEEYNLTVKATSGDKSYNDIVTLTRDLKNTSILIQTDKPIYKPGETVKFRVLILNRFLQPFDSDKPIDLTITDPQSNIIKSWKALSIPANRGFISDKFELSIEPNLGDWSIEAQLNNREKETYRFSVDQYVLPKFKVEVKISPSFVTYNESKVIAEVSSIYNYGKPVAGECTLELKEPYTYYYPEGRVQSVMKTVPLQEGKGQAFVEFDVKTELKIERDEINTYGKEFVIQASCKDSVSGQIRNGTTKFKMYKYPYKVEMVDTPSSIKPGFPINITLKISTQDDQPIGSEDKDALKIEHGFSFDADGGVVMTSVPKTGIVVIPFVVPTNPKVCYEYLEVTFKELKENMYLPRKFVSPLGSYAQLKLLTDKPRENEEITVNMKSSKPLKSLNTILIARGVVLKTEHKTLPQTLDYDIKFTIPEGSSPKAQLIVYSVLAPNNDVLVDTLKLDIEADKKQDLDISLSESTLEPGSNITINLKALPNSIIALRAVDQSVLLLKKDNDITTEKLANVANSFDNSGNRYRYWGGGESYQSFINAGLNIMTNGIIERAPSRYTPMKQFSSGSGRPESQGVVSFDMEMNSPPGANRVAAAPQQSVRVRSFFPETWIWEDFEAPEGQLNVQKTVPDTITSWQINGFQITKEHGLGLAQKEQKLTVFRPFFISLNLPYSIVKGEVLGLQVMVHNYMEEPITAQVSLENTDGFFKFLEEGDSQKMVKEVKVNASAITSVTFPITPVKFGIMNLNVKAISKNAGDAVTRPLIVKPPGVKQTQNSAILLNLLKDKSLKQTVSAIFPDERVPDADSLKVSVLGDILGGTMNNLDKLIRLPNGCGEQNMLNFVPDVVILDYLKTTGGLTPEIKRKALRFLEKGYQQQLTYLRYDGSFSAFGKSDRMGSTWLTAFVTRAFISAQRYITIDDKIIQKSLKFLISQHNDNGSFAEDGFVYDKSLQGGAGQNKYALTAYTLLTFQEAKTAGIDLKKLSNDSIIEKGVEYLVNETSQGQLRDPYGVNLITHLLHVIDHPKKEDYFKMMEDLAKIDLGNNTKYWKSIQKQDITEEQSKRLYRPWQPRIKPASVEMTSYALLTYILKGGDKISDSVPIATWLMKQRNAEGGFLSTQDTVVGITALAKFAEAVNTRQNLDSDINVKVSWGPEGDAKPGHEFYIGKDNKTTLQEYFLPLNVREINLEATGQGTALAQLTWNYYIEAKDNSPAFDLKVEVHDKDKGRTVDLKVCASYIRGDQSNMAILEANAPSGYAFDQEELESLRRATGAFARFETEDRDSKLNLYFQSLNGTETCVDLHAYRVYLVAKHTKGHVLIYDYYDTTQRAQEFYDGPAVSTCDICSVDNSCEIKNCA